jgi:hypothetical protein
MKSTFLIVATISLLMLCSTQHAVAQTKEMSLKLAGITLYNIEPSGDSDFLVIYGKALLSKNGKKNVMKFNKNLEPLWKAPVVFTGMSSEWARPVNYVYYQDKVCFSYTNATDKTAFDYIFGIGQFLQIRADGTVKEQKTGLYMKEAEKTAAVFTDINGLNVLTLAGDETFPTGMMNWYTFAHKDLALTKRKITLPMPSNTDKDNESGWRLNEVTPSGLHFYYVSYKNNRKDLSRPILAAHVVSVDQTGKAGLITNMVYDFKKYTIMPVEFQQDIYPQLVVAQPELYQRGMNPGTSMSRATPYAVPSDNAYLGIKIDATAKRIYTVAAVKEDSAERKGMTFSARPHDELAYLDFSTYDYNGQKIAESHLKFKLPELSTWDDYDKHAHKIDILLLPDNEGVVCKLLSNGHGFLWTFNQNGAPIQKDKIEITYKIPRSSYYMDVFATPYFSLKDVQNAPYVLKSKSKSYQFYQKLDDKIKRTTLYYSLKDYELITTWDRKADKIDFYSFSKN